MLLWSHQVGLLTTALQHSSQVQIILSQLVIASSVDVALVMPMGNAMNIPMFTQADWKSNPLRLMLVGSTDTSDSQPVSLVTLGNPQPVPLRTVRPARLGRGGGAERSRRGRRGSDAMAPKASQTKVIYSGL